MMPLYMHCELMKSDPIFPLMRKPQSRKTELVIESVDNTAEDVDSS